MRSFRGRYRHELDSVFLENFFASFGEEELSKLVVHLDAFPGDGDAPFQSVSDFRVCSWEVGALRRDIFYLYREKIGVLVYVDCVEPPPSDSGWFQNLDPVRLLETALAVVDLIERLFGLLRRSQEETPQPVLGGGSLDYLQGKYRSG